MGKAVVIVLSTAIPLAVAGVAGAVVLILQRRKRPVLNPPTASAGSLLRHSSLLWYQQQPVFVLKNGTGCTVELSPIGASITRLVIPDKKGKKADVVLSYDCPSELVVREGCPCSSSLCHFPHCRSHRAVTIMPEGGVRRFLFIFWV